MSSERVVRYSFCRPSVCSAMAINTSLSPYQKLSSAGALENRHVWAQFEDDINPEGICLDRAGAIWMAGAGCRALLVKEGGAIERQVSTKRPVFATALGGPDRKYLFLCTSDSNDPVATRLVQGATIDIAEVKNS